MAWGFLVDVLLGGGGSKRGTRNVSKLLKKGHPAQATVVSMRRFAPKIRRNVSESDHRLEPHLQVGLHVHDPSFIGGFEATVDNFEDLRIGEVIPVKHDGERVVPALRSLRLVTGGDHAQFCDPPSQHGIVDETLWNHVAIKRREDAIPAWITFTDAEVGRTSGLQFGRQGHLFGLEIVGRALVQGEGFDDFRTDMVRIERRGYASHLDELNLPLPGWARPSSKRTPFIVDWAAAANRDPGVGRPAGYFDRLMSEKTNMQIGGGEVTENSWTPAGAIADSAAHDAIDGISFEQWASIVAHCEVDKIRFPDQDEYAQRFGVPAGRWGAMNSEWSKRMMRDPRLNIAMAQIRKDVKKSR